MLKSQKDICKRGKLFNPRESLMVTSTVSAHFCYRFPSGTHCKHLKAIINLTMTCLLQYHYSITPPHRCRRRNNSSSSSRCRSPRLSSLSPSHFPSFHLHCFSRVSLSLSLSPRIFLNSFFYRDIKSCSPLSFQPLNFLFFYFFISLFPPFILFFFGCSSFAIFL